MSCRPFSVRFTIGEPYWVNIFFVRKTIVVQGWCSKCQLQRNHCSGCLFPGNIVCYVGRYLGIQTANLALEWDDGARALVDFCCPTVRTFGNFHKFPLLAVDLQCVWTSDQ